jgi:hypothetical protein
MPVPIPLVMGGMIIASERIRPAWREPARAPFTGAGSIQGAWPRRSAGRPSGAGDPDGGRSGGETMDPQPAPTCRHGRKTGAPEA